MRARTTAGLLAAFLAACLGPNPAFNEPAGGTSAHSGTGSSEGSTGNASSPPGSSSASASASSTTVAPQADSSGGTGKDASSGDAEESGVSGGEALLVVGDVTFATTNDQPVADTVAGLGYNLTVIATTDVQTSDTMGADLVVVSSTGSAVDLVGLFRDVPVPLVTWEGGLYPDLGLTADTQDIDFGVQTETEEISIVGAIGGGVGPLRTATVLAPPPGAIVWGVPSETAWVAATQVGDGSRATLFGYEAGALGADDLPLPARRGAFPSSSSSAMINAEGIALLEELIVWATQ